MRTYRQFKTPLMITMVATLAVSLLPAQTTQTKERSQDPESTRQSSGKQSSPRQQTSPAAQSSESQRSEASKEELKVEATEAKKEVTDINKASNIIGMKVVNKANDDIGEIKDLVVDFESGKIAYAVLESGGTLGVGAKLIAIPAESLRPQQGAKALLLDADKDRLSQAPGFNEDNWPNIDAAIESSVGLSPTGRPSKQSGRSDDKSQSERSEEKTQSGDQQTQR